MRQVHYFSFFLFLFAAISFASCSDDDNDNDNGSQTGITGQSWEEGTPIELTAGSTRSVSFNAAAKWKAHTNSTWCKLQTTEGEKGAGTIRLSVTTTSTKDRTSIITIQVQGYSTTSFQVIQKGSSTTVSEDVEINGKVDEYLRKMYLWNDEYKTLDLDYTKNYEAFFYDALGSMKKNTLDKKPYTGNDGKTYYRLFSYIQLLPDISSTRATKIVDKEQAYSFGITGITPVTIGDQTQSTTYFCLQGIYPESPASEAGLKRGMMISRINGKNINNSNFEDFYYNLLLPNSAFSYTLTEDVIEGGGVTGQKEYSIASKAMYNNPILFSKVEEDIEGHKIGYLVYSGFEAGFDEELFNVFKEFKSKNITDLILDLRYNGGGHTMSANLIATCIAGNASQGKVFTKLRYNAERMAERDNKMDDEQFAYSNYPNLGTSLSAGALNLPRVYCLVGAGTASSSELVINSLEGIDLDVILIGERTTGKNVGMEYEDMKVRDNTYRVVPITFQSYNAKEFGDYQDGFKPDVEMDETNPYNQENTFYIHREYMSNEEPLYAKAIELITGKNPMPTTRSAENMLEGKTRKLPAIFRPGRDAMLMPAKTAE